MSGHTTVPAPARVCAHRGDSSTFRENTLPAIRSAIDKGADIVEIDVRLTADGEVVVLHDATLERLWGDPRAVSSVPADAVAALGDADHRPPLLREVLPLFTGAAARLVIDMEDTGPAAAAHAVVRAAGARVEWCGDLEAMRMLRALDPHAHIWLPWRRSDPPTAADVAELAPILVNVPFVLADGRFVGAVHGLGLALTAWTVDEEHDMARLLALGVDTLTTNRLDRLQAMIGGGAASVDEPLAEAAR